MIIINYVLRYVCQFHSILVTYKLARIPVRLRFVNHRHCDHNRLLAMIIIDYQIFVDGIQAWIK